MPAPIIRVYLTGFMGAGKSTVGRILAGRLGWTFFDIDAVIEAEKKCSVAAFFAQHGESAFRKLEHETIHRLHRSSEAVLSLGGGALETPEVRALIHSQAGTHVVFLDAPLPLLIDRCLAQDGGDGRPILQSALKDRAHLDERYRFRRAFYQNAHLTVATQSRTPEEVADSIQQSLAALDHGHSAKQSG